MKRTNADYIWLDGLLSGVYCGGRGVVATER
jgi:hypothetical protein